MDQIDFSRYSRVDGAAADAAPESTGSGTSVVEDFGRSMAYSGVQSPLDAVAQLCGSKAPQLFQAPKEAEFGSGGWYAQQFGAGIGALPLFVGVNKGIGRFAGPTSGPVFRAALSGLVFEGLFHPTTPDAPQSVMLNERGRNAVFGMATFAAMARASDMCLNAGLGRLSGAVTPGWNVRTFLKDATMNATRGAIAGTFGGIVNAELYALEQGKTFAEPEALLRSAYSFGVMGAGLDMLGTHKWLPAKGPLIDDAGVAQCAGKHVADANQVVHRTDGAFDLVPKGTRTRLNTGDVVLGLQTMEVGKPGGKFGFGFGDLQFTCDSTGTPVEFKNGSGVKTTYDWQLDGSGKRQLAAVWNASDAASSGGTEPVRMVSLKDGIYYDANGVALGTHARLLSNGDLIIAGFDSAGKTQIGTTLSTAIPSWYKMVTISPEGKRCWETTNGTIMNERADGKIVHLRFADMEVNYGYDSANGELNQVGFAGGRQITKQGELWLDQNGQPVATEVTVHRDGNLVVKPTQNIRSPHNPLDVIKEVWVHPTWRESHYTFDIQPKAPQEVQQTRTVPSLEDILFERGRRGELTHSVSDGSLERTGISGEKTRYRSDGKIIGVTTTTGRQIGVDLDGSGEPHRIRIEKNGRPEHSFLRDDVGWEKFDGKGNRLARLQQVTIDVDGAITELGAQASWDGVKTRADGVRIKVDAVGRERIGAEHLELERDRVLKLMEKPPTDASKPAPIREWMATFEKRAASRVPPVPREEIANAYYQVDRMLSTEQSVLNFDMRLGLAKAFLFKAAHPHTISQGRFNTCNVTAEIENRFVTKYPSAAMRIVADAATSGRVVLSDGTLIDMTLIRNALEPLAGFDQLFDPVRFNGRRDYFDQVLQTAAVNSFWQRQDVNLEGKAASTVADLRAGQPYTPGDLRYELTRTSPDTLELIADYSMDPPVRRLGVRAFVGADPITGANNVMVEYRPSRGPELRLDWYSEIERLLLGKVDHPHVVASQGAGFFGDVVNVTGAGELESRLFEIKRAGALPATILVDGNSLLFGLRTPTADSARHVINVQNIYKDKGVTRIEFTNQWGDTFNHLGRDRAISPGALWEAMKTVGPEPLPALDLSWGQPRFSPEWITFGLVDALFVGAAHIQARDDQRKRREDARAQAK